MVGSRETGLWLQAQTIQCIRQRNSPFFPALSVPDIRSKSKVCDQSPLEDPCELSIHSGTLQPVPLSGSSKEQPFCLFLCGFFAVYRNGCFLLKNCSVSCWIRLPAYRTFFSHFFPGSLNALVFFQEDYACFPFLAPFCLFTRFLYTCLNSCCGHYHFLCL